MMVATKAAAQEAPMQRNGATEAGTAGLLKDAWRIFGARHLPHRVMRLGRMLDRLTVQKVRERAGMGHNRTSGLLMLTPVGQAIYEGIYRQRRVF